MSIKDKDTMEAQVVLLRARNIPTKGHRLTRKSARHFGGINDELSLDRFFVQLINDTLDTIRKGKVAYVYTTDHIKEILRFEPEAEFSYYDGAVAVRLAA